MKIKRANHYKTRTGRRIAVILYAIPVIPLSIALGAVWGACEWVAELRGPISETWRK